MQIPVRIVLVEPSHPGNIGASARAMKTMGLEELVLVAPRDFPSAEATARASGADDVLARARVVDSLADAIGDCGFVAGASARLRHLSWPAADPRRGAATLWERSLYTTVAMVFGPERSGLTNEDLGRCNQVVHIPANPAYSSLNVAMAVQVLCYELRMAALDHQMGAEQSTRPAQETDAAQAAHTADALEAPIAAAASQAGPTADLWDAAPTVGTNAAQAAVRGAVRGAAKETGRKSPPATAAELEGFHLHLESALRAAGFLKENRSRQLKLRLRRIFQRSSLDRNEINILRGALTALAGDRRREPLPTPNPPGDRRGSGK